MSMNAKTSQKSVLIMKNIDFDIENKGKAIDFACNVCPRKCDVNRQNKLGVCKSKGLRIARYGLHMWEEPCISGDSGSGTIFFSGCSLRCIYCQNYEVSQLSKGYDISVADLVRIFKEIEQMGANNINLVTPTHYTDYIIKALDIYKPKIPVCYNTSGYESVESLQKLKDYIDIYLADFKYMDSGLALEYSNAKDYPEIAKQAILQMRANQPVDIFNEKGIMEKGLIVRHLLLPDCIQNSKDIIAWVTENLGKETILSLMSQYTPYGIAKEHNILGRKVKPIEYKIVVNFAIKMGLNNSFIQELDSASDIYVPEFYGD